MYQKFIHVVPVNKACVITRCLEIDMRKIRESVFGLTFQRDFQCQPLKSSLRHNSTERDKMMPLLVILQLLRCDLVTL